MSTTLTLFDLTALTPNQPATCGWCSHRPATTHVTATQNLLGIHPTWLAPTRYRDAIHTAHSGPCCEKCAWNLAAAWWNSSMSCPNGACCLWAHTLGEPRPGWDCPRHHTENTVVWCTPAGVAS